MPPKLTSAGARLQRATFTHQIHPIMNPLVSKLVKKHHMIRHMPLLLDLLECGANVEPEAPTSDRPTRRTQQMRLLRQWERVEKAVAAFVAVGAADDDLLQALPYTEADLRRQDDLWWWGVRDEVLRVKIAEFIIHVSHKVDMASPFFDSTKSGNGSGPLKAPAMLERQFEVIVEGSAPSHTMLDKFLRGSLKASQCLADLLEHAKDPTSGDGEETTERLLRRAEAALSAQGFTR